jgi:hypothetical protein
MTCRPISAVGSRVNAVVALGIVIEEQIDSPGSGHL